MPRYLGDITQEPLYTATRTAIEERKFHEKIPCADVLRAAEPGYDAMTRYQRNTVDWIVGTSAKRLGYRRVRTTIPGVKPTYFYVYDGPAAEPGQPVHHPKRAARRVTYENPELDPWLPIVRQAIEDHKIRDQAPTLLVFRTIDPDYDHLPAQSKADMHYRVGLLVKHLGYFRVRSSAVGYGTGWFYRKFDLSTPRLRRSGHYPELYDRQGRPRL